MRLPVFALILPPDAALVPSPHRTFRVRHAPNGGDDFPKHRGFWTGAFHGLYVGTMAANGKNNLSTFPWVLRMTANERKNAMAL